MVRKITLEQLARSTQEEFSSVRKEMQNGFKAIASILDLMRADISDVKITLPPLIRSEAALECDAGDLKKPCRPAGAADGDIA